LKANKIDWPKSFLFWVENRTIFISVVFTWDLPKVRQMVLQRGLFWDKAIIGGPAISLFPDYFLGIDYVKTGDNMPGMLQRINPLATRTTTGCIRKCEFCAVWKTEGRFNELSDWPNLPVICDNNLFASSIKHFDKVMNRLKVWGWVDFNQGVDSRLLKKHHAERIAEIKKPLIRLALDSMDYVDNWEKSYEILRNVGLPKSSIRSYALIGFDSGPEEAWKRCQFINLKGIKPLPMWFHSLKSLKKNIVSDEQKKLGWTDFERRLIMQYYYQHGKRRELILKDYGWRLK
jgi:hypothetical protein